MMTPLNLEAGGQRSNSKKDSQPAAIFQDLEWEIIS